MKKTPKTPKPPPKKEKKPRVPAIERAIEALSPIKVATLHFAIQFVDKKTEEPVWGTTNFTKQAFSIRRGLHPEMTLSVLFHECLHAVIFSHAHLAMLTDLEREWKGSEIINAINEEFVCGLETGLLALFADNPKLYALIGRHCK